MSDSGIFSEILNYEQECRRDGYNEGLVKGRADGIVEGRTAGLETGFERYRALGVLQGRVAAWRNDNLPEKQQKAVDSLATLVSPPTIDNEQNTFTDFERRIKLAKNKSRIIAMANKSPAVNAEEMQVRTQRDDAAIEEI